MISNSDETFGKIEAIIFSNLYQTKLILMKNFLNWLMTFAGKMPMYLWKERKINLFTPRFSMNINRCLKKKLAKSSKSTLKLILFYSLFLGIFYQES
jgi:hypothetical protein